MTKFIKSLSPATRQAVTSEIIDVLKKKYPDQISSEITVDDADFTTYGSGPGDPNEVSPEMQSFLANKKKEQVKYSL